MFACVRRCLVLVLSVVASAVYLQGQAHPLPVLQKNGPVTQLMVDGQPYLVLGGELHNSTASSVAYMRPVFARLAELHLNTVIGTVSWELMEPEEGRFDYALVDAQLAEARRYNMRLVLIWFGTWKNTGSTYVPLWVKTQPQRFAWAQQLVPPTPEHPKRGLYALSAFCEATKAADARAFAALMHHLREVDAQHTVVMMQVENETGILTEGREYSPGAEAVWKAPVPIGLTSYLAAHKATLLPEVARTWEAHGSKTSGTWAEVFGDDAYGGEIFMAWGLGRFIEGVVEAGKKEMALPMYVNAWLVQNDKQEPGGYPSGGPVSRVMDVWRAAGPSIDLFAPDIYISDVDGVMSSYTRSGNPLFIPEFRNNPGNALWAISNYHAIGVSPFGVDDVKPGDALGVMYEEVGGAMPVVEKAMAEGKLAGFPSRNAGSYTTTLGGFNLKVDYVATSISAVAPPRPNAGEAEAKDADVMPDVVARTRALGVGETGYGMVVEAGPNWFYLFGRNITVTFQTPPPGRDDSVIYDCEEGYFDKGVWVAGRTLEGDERSKGLRGVVMPSNRFVVRRIKLYKHDAPGWQ